MPSTAALIESISSSTNSARPAQSRDLPRKEWVLVKTIQNVAAGLAVEINRLDLTRPKYSLSIGRIRSDKDEGKKFMNSNLPVTTDGKGKIEVVSLSEIISDLTTSAEQWIQEDAQQKEDDYLEFKAQKESRSADRGKSTARSTGKTAKQKAKKSGRIAQV